MRQRALFAFKFGAWLVVLYLLLANHWINDRVVVPFTAGIALVCGSALSLFSSQVVVSGTTILMGAFGADVRNGCNGLEAMMVLAAGVLAFPADARQRLAGLAVGTLLIQLLNVIRVTSLVMLGAWRRDLFDLFHVAIWQTAIVLAALGIFVMWSRRVAAPVPADR